MYAHHDNGFALFSMRSPSVTRLYLQCLPDEDLAQWSDARIWDELHTRFANRSGWTPAEGTITQKSVTPMRSFVCETMRPRPAVPGRRRRAHRAADRSRRA
ncbi:MAG: 4-hydroxybenzoate 3-monooxygenase (NAD(P)H) [Burkholderia plantarii]|nr:MAG: 4-hydroxybenzoate 3-monooxygenase (NAD(P)H) [Burkholderia plantarii]